MVQMRSIFLVGFMGSGKSSAGAALASLLGLRFIDLDDEIARQLGAPIPEVFATLGEGVFRDAESDELIRYSGLDDVVVATGGGAFCTAGNREAIHGSGGSSVFLDLCWEALENRLAGDHGERPMYGDAERAKRLFEERMPHYLCATVRVQLDGAEAPEEVARLVADSLRGAPCAT